MSRLAANTTPAERRLGCFHNIFQDPVSYFPFQKKTGPKRKNLIGKEFGELTVLGPTADYVSPQGHHHTAWRCLCSCGELCSVRTTALLTGKTKSCGHLINGRKDIKGLRFGNLVVIRDTGKSNKHGKAIWECQCDCGNICTATAYILNKGEKKSCGCLSRVEHPAAKDLYRSYRKNAKARGYQFDLSFEMFCQTIQQDCYYCGISMSNIRKTRYKGEDFPYNGIDRLNNNLGYDKNNCVPCCQVCNIAKMQMSEEEFYQWICRVYKHTKGRMPNVPVK